MVVILHSYRRGCWLYDIAKYLGAVDIAWLHTLVLVIICKSPSDGHVVLSMSTVFLVVTKSVGFFPF